VAFAAPVAGLLLLGGGYSMLVHPSVVTSALALTVALLVGLIPGPAYRDWILTSECRLVPQKPAPPPANER
jgi:hypothetical protein